MRADFTPGTKVRFKIENGAMAVINNSCPSNMNGQPQYDWKIPGYMGEGFYGITMENGKEMIASEDDLELVNKDELCCHNNLIGECASCDYAADWAADRAREDGC